jgi:hypothetical protein
MVMLLSRQISVNSRMGSWYFNRRAGCVRVRGTGYDDTHMRSKTRRLLVYSDLQDSDLSTINKEGHGG